MARSRSIKEKPNETSPKEKQQLHILMQEPLQPGPTGVGVSMDVETITPKRIKRTIRGKTVVEFVYSVKFVCGRIPHSLADPQEPPSEFPLVPGTYRTAININNPNPSTVRFEKMALTTNPQGQPRGKAGEPVEESLGKNEGLEIGCHDIGRLLNNGGSGVDLSNNSNFDLVFQQSPSPPNRTLFILNAPAYIKQLVTYHWNVTQQNPQGGDDPTTNPKGTIKLLDQNGQPVVSGNALGVSGQGNRQNVNWVADITPPIPLQPGTYIVEDSRPSTWSYNQQSGEAGFAIVRGTPFFAGTAPFSKGFVVIRSEKELDVVGVYTVKNVISSVPNPPNPSGDKCPEIKVNIRLDPIREVYHLHDPINISVEIQGGQPPYNPVVVTLNSPSLRAPYNISSTPSLTDKFSQTWYVYLVGPPPVPGTWGHLKGSTISVAVTDANGCKASGTSRQFELMSP